jgi:hypothetical protein
MAADETPRSPKTRPNQTIDRVLPERDKALPLDQQTTALPNPRVDRLVEGLARLSPDDDPGVPARAPGGAIRTGKGAFMQDLGCEVSEYLFF